MAIDSTTSRRLRRRLLPLHAAVLLQGVALWVPVEKLFMTEIGFDAASIGVMAAIYAAVVPVIEIPSGILADRWSRRGVLIVANVALLLAVLIGGLSTSVTTYFVSAMVLGVFFAMNSGTMDSIVYDTVLEETGGSGDFERRIGRIRVMDSIALVTSALAGGWLAMITSTRLTYFMTTPFVALSVVALLAFREPRLHNAGEATSLRSHIATTYRTILQRGRLLPIATLMVLTALLLQVVLEFGPLWLVALAAPAIFYGPHFAGLTSALGLGGVLAGRLRFTHPVTLAAVVALMVLSSVTLALSHDAIVVTVAQVVLAVLVVAASIFLTRLLHDAVPSAVRSGVASGVGALSWIAFLPFALIFGVVTERAGVHTAGWMITAATVLAGALLMMLGLDRRVGDPAEPVVAVEPEAASVAPMDL
jgi:MFS family permease